MKRLKYSVLLTIFLMLISEIQSAFSSVTPTAEIDNETKRLILDTVKFRHTTHGSIRGQAAYGIFLNIVFTSQPMSHGNECDYIAVVRATHNIGRGARTDHYRVCASHIAEYRPDTVVPSYPDTRDAQTVLRSAMIQAMDYEFGVSHFQDYTVNTNRLTPVRNGCWKIEVIVTYEGMLSLYERRNMCP